MARQEKIDGIGVSVVTATSTITEIPTTIGRRDYIKILNNSSVIVKIFPSAIATDGFTIAATGGVFEENTNAPIFIQSTGVDTPVDVYERKNR